MLAELVMLASTCAPDIHFDTLRAVIKHESRGNQFAVGINKGEKLRSQPKNLEDAVRIAKDLVKRNIDFDAGLGQINVRNWKWLGLTPETVFDPCTNLRAAQTVLKDCYVRAQAKYPHPQEALLAAFSCYNTGNFERGFTNGYVDRVLVAAEVKVPGITKETAQQFSARKEHRDSTAEGSHAPSARGPSTESVSQHRPDAFSRARPDAFSQTRPDAFAQRRPDAFDRTAAARLRVGSIVYHR